VGTPKRERQKANRAARQIQEAHAAKTTAVKRNTIRWGAAIVAAFAAVLLIAWIGGAFSGDDDGTDDLAVTTDPIVSAAPGTDPATSDPAATDPAASVPATSPTTDAATVECPPTDGSPVSLPTFAEYPPMCIDPANSYTAEIVTNKGDLTVELFADRAPLTVNSFVTLARFGYFDGISCHRIIPNFVAQCGDPTGTGTGGPGYEFADELPEAGEYQIGSLAMANAGPNTNGSQFFIITGSDGAALPPSYSLFGQVTEGLDTTVPALDAAGSPGGVPPLEPVNIESITITES